MGALEQDIIAGDLIQTHQQLASGYKPDTQDIQAAIDAGQVQILKQLVKFGADLTKASLRKVLDRDDIEMLKYLHAQMPERIADQLEKPQPQAVLAINESVKILDYVSDFVILDSAYSVAVGRNILPVVKVILKHQSNLAAGLDPLVIASKNGYDDVVKEIMSHRDVNVLLLEELLDKHNEQALLTLLKNSPDSPLYFDLVFPLLQEGYVSCVKHLIERGNVITQKHMKHITDRIRIEGAVKAKQKAQLFRLMMDQGLDPFRDIKAYTAGALIAEFIYAPANDLIKQLLPLASDGYGQSFIYAAINEHNDEALKMLLDAGYNATNYDLSVALHKENMSAIKILVDHGVRLEDLDGINLNKYQQAQLIRYREGDEAFKRFHQDQIIKENPELERFDGQKGMSHKINTDLELLKRLKGYLND